MECWADEAFGSGPSAMEALLEFCGAYPHTTLPDVLGRRSVDWPVHSSHQPAD